MRRLESPRRLFVVWFVVTILLALTACLGGCAAHDNGDVEMASGLWGLFGIAAGCTLVCVVFLGRDSLKVAVIFIGLAIMAALGGCAALPMPFQPVAQDNSNKAEGAWLVLDAVDTLQTVQIAKHHNCFRESDPLAAWIYGSKYPNAGRVVLTNIVLATAHTMVTSWLDDKVATGSIGWYRARVAWHTGSLLYSGVAVAHNMQQGLGLTTVHNSDCTP